MGLGAEKYYLDTVARGFEEYYSGAGESPGLWMGAGCFDLGLSGEVAPDDLRAVLSGLSPQDRSELAVNRVPPERRVAGFDLTFSAPKSVSVLYGLWSDEVSNEVREAHREAALDALGYLESHATYARRGKNGMTTLKTSGFVAAGYTHRTSRNGDPQLHTHVLAANLVHASDGRWSTLYSNRLHQHIRTAGFVYQASLRHGLSCRLGVTFGPVVKGAAEIAGMPEKLLKRFSTRRAEIVSRLDELDGSSRRTRELAALETRQPKDLAKSEDTIGLRERWRSECLELGFGPAELNVVFSRPPRSHEITEKLAGEIRKALFGWTGLTKDVSVFERRDLVRGIAERLANGGRLYQIEHFAEYLLGDPEVVRLDRVARSGEEFLTTKGMLEVEAKLLNYGVTLGAVGKKVPGEIVEAVLSERPEISEEQAEMVRRLTTSGEGLQVVVGKAGTGKTYALDAARAAFQRAGYLVYGTALSARAASELESGSGIPSCTLARFMDLDNLLGVEAKSVIVVDEAGMVSTRDLERLVFHATRRGASVILVGDDRQLPEIEAGGAFRALSQLLDAIQLTENRRQHEPWEREALDELRCGDVANAVVAYTEHERLHLCDSAPATRAAMVADWAVARGEDTSARMYALARSDVEELNRLARAELKSSGVLGDDILQVGDRAYAVGDEVLFCRNDRDLSVLNGTRGTVTGLDGDHLLVETDRGQRAVPLGYLEEGHLAHGYASTIHKAQGATVDRAFVLGGEAMYREAGYVALSRARERTDMYITASAFDEGLAGDWGKPGITDALSASRAKELATEFLDPKRAAEIESEQAALKDRLRDQPHDPKDERRFLEKDRAQLDHWPEAPAQSRAELAEKDARVHEKETALEIFKAAHRPELERKGVLDAARRIGTRLLGAAAVQHPSPELTARLGEVPELPIERSLWSRAAGVVQHHWQRRSRAGRDDELERPERAREDLKRELFDIGWQDKGRSRGIDDDRGRSL